MSGQFGTRLPGVNADTAQEITAQRDSPEGGLWAIRAKNGWDDSLPPVLGPDFQSKVRNKSIRNQVALKTYESEFGVMESA